MSIDWLIAMSGDRFGPNGVAGAASRLEGTYEMKILGFALVFLGIIALAYGGISYNREKTVLGVGDFKATVTEQKNIPLSPIVGGIVLVSGLALLMVRRKRLAWAKTTE
jgi:uncharacterized membrane protein